jgi:hypothetical protein
VPQLNAQPDPRQHANEADATRRAICY